MTVADRLYWAASSEYLDLLKIWIRTEQQIRRDGIGSVFPMLANTGFSAADVVRAVVNA